MSATSIRDVLESFLTAFNDNDLDGVMNHFAEEAVYEYGGKTHRGHAAIRAAFEPQFMGAFGKMYFDVDDHVVDEREKKAAIRWTCRHDMQGEHGRAVNFALRAWIRVRFGGRASWYGMDFFRYDEEAKITGKFSFAAGAGPRIERQEKQGK